jgi:hypothetical protein
MPPSDETLIRRIVSNPVDHIKCRNLAALQGYFLGYRMACETWSIPCVLSEYDVNAVHHWLLDQLEATEEHRGRLNAFNWLSLENWARFLTYDERDAFDAYLELWAAAPRREASDPESSKIEEPQSPPRPQRSFLEMLEPLRKRPGMYFGVLPNALTVWSFCSGFHWAERDHGLSPSLAEPVLTQFPGWLAERYPFSRGAPWHNLFDALSTFHPMGAIECFEEHLRLFQEGRPSDTPDPGMVEMWKNINAVKN